jgi:hypothetical protein
MESLTAVWPILSILLSMLGVVLWSMITDLKGQVKDTQKDFSDFKVVVAEKYASREEMRMAMESIRESLQRLNDKLDNFIKENK